MSVGIYWHVVSVNDMMSPDVCRLWENRPVGLSASWVAQEMYSSTLSPWFNVVSAGETVVGADGGLSGGSTLHRPTLPATHYPV